MEPRAEVRQCDPKIAQRSYFEEPQQGRKNEAESAYDGMF